MRFVDPRRWRPSRYNPENIVRRVRMPDGAVARVTVFLKEGKYMVYLNSSNSEGGSCHPEKYSSQAEAKTVAFELVEGLKENREQE